ncbi:hypothetical protein Sste5346_009503 [Sporothrix stenoceras]|uniref:Uncharacterized protein n=1 Tax=Sporothrix stenoceras TaxID=5173 RepID=A0ABR3YL05_9PEZI
MGSNLVSLRAIMDTPTATVAFILGIALGILGVYKCTAKSKQARARLPLTKKPTVDPNDIVSLRPPSRRHALPPSGTFENTLDGDISATDISLPEIRHIVGTFPDYAVLSGVPHPQPCPSGFVLEKARFRPFRPFRWRYHQHMALMKLDPDYWLELEHGYKTSLETRHALVKEHSEKILFCNDDELTSLACRELLEMALQFVCHRYPQYFEVRDNVFINRVLDTKTQLDKAYGRDALQILFDNIPEDFAIVTRSDDDGRYRLRAAVVCSSVGWYIGQHRGKPLHGIHAKVTDYATKMARSMDRYFARMPTDQPIQRGSWSIEEGKPLFVPHDDDRPNRDGGLHFRCDWQTLRRLPLTGAIVFNFKATFTLLTDLRTEPYVPALLHQILNEGDQRLVTPGKCMEHTRQDVLPPLRSWADEQAKAGVVPDDWEPRTLDESPFYPGWEAVWRTAQGF